MRVLKAVSVAIRYHFGNALGFEREIYDKLLELADNNPFDIIDSANFHDINPDIYVWNVFEDMPNRSFIDLIDSLINDIIAEFSGE